MIRHLAGVTEIVDDVDGAVAFYESSGLSVRRLFADYAIVDMPGVLNFALASRALYAEATHGSRDDVEKVAVGFVVGFEVDDAEAAQATLGDRVIKGRTEEYQQVIVRFASPSGTACEACETPGSRSLTQAPSASG